MDNKFLTDEELKRFSEKDKRSRRIGLYITAIFHLLLIIVLLIFSISYMRREEVSFITDSEGRIAKERQLAEEQKQEEIKALAKSQLEEQMAATPQNLKAIPVSSNTSQLKDDRNTDTRQLKEDMDRLAGKVRETAAIETPKGVDDVPDAGPVTSQEPPKKIYIGPSVLNWSLEGRRAFSLPIPVYKCRGGGDVTVRIYVQRNGYVQKAQVEENASVPDGCIRNAALAAAKKSRFSMSDTAPEPQIGQITYRFVSQ